MSAPPSAGVQDLLADRYLLQERIAVGGMGEVWRAEDTLLSRPVAVKTLKTEYVDDPEFRERFRLEARHAARLTHPGIASVHDYGEGPGRAWLVMELVDGEPLSAVLRREGALRPDRVLDLVAQTARALHAAHTGGVIHRDVKPGNLLVRPDGVLKVTDFGIASVADAVPLTRTGIVVGTAHYLSPEQAAGRPVSPRSDVYSLGIVAYECLAGARPFRADSPVAVAMAHLHQDPPPLPDHIPSPVRELVLRALSKDPAERPADAAAFAAAATTLREALVGGADVPALPVDPPTEVRPDGAAEPTSLIPAPTRSALPPRPLNGSRPVATGADDDDTRLAPLPAAGPRTSPYRRLVPVLLAGLLLLAGAAGVRSLGSGGEPAASPAPVPTVPMVVEAPAPVTVDVDPARYVGRPAADVERELAQLGLRPRAVNDGSGTPPGTVGAVDPAGTLELGAEVVVHVVPQPPPPPAGPQVVAPAPAPAPQGAVAPAPKAPKASGNAGGNMGGGGKGSGGGKGNK